MAEAAEAEVAVRSVNVGARHGDAAVRARPPGILADREHPARPLRHLLGVVVQVTGQVASVAEDVALAREPLRGLLTRLAVQIRLHPALHLPDTGASELETLRGDILVDVAEVGLADGLLDQLREADRLVVGDRAPHLLRALGEKLLERGPVAGVGEREELIVREVVQEPPEGTCGCRCHERTSFCSQ